MAVYSRPRIAKEFSINERTLTWLERTGKLTLEWKTSNGLLVTELTDDAKRVLTCAPISAYAFNTQIGLMWPFQRFMFLRFLQVPVEELYQELTDRNLIFPHVFTLAKLTIIRDKFVSRLPLLVQRCMQLDRQIETDEEKLYFETVLDLCEIKMAYENPELEQSFKFMIDPVLKECLDCSLSTKSSFVDVQKFLLEALQFRISIEGLAFYQSLFHDVNLLQTEELKNYLKHIKPSTRSKMLVALSGTIDDFRLKTHIDEERDTTKVLTVLKDQLVSDLITNIGNKTPESEKNFFFTLRGLMIVLDRIDKPSAAKSASGSNVPSFFKSLKIVPGVMEESKIFRLPPADQSQVAES